MAKTTLCNTMKFLYRSSLDVERFAPKGSEEEEPGYIQMSPVHRSTSSPRDSFLSQVKRE